MSRFNLRIFIDSFLDKENTKIERKIYEKNNQKYKNIYDVRNGILENTDILIEENKIVDIAQNCITCITSPAPVLFSLLYTHHLNVEDSMALRSRRKRRN